MTNIGVPFRAGPINDELIESEDKIIGDFISGNSNITDKDIKFECGGKQFNVLNYNSKKL